MSARYRCEQGLSHAYGSARTVTGTPLFCPSPLGAPAGAEPAGVLAGPLSLAGEDGEAAAEEGGEDDAGAVPSAVTPAAPTGRCRPPSPSPSEPPPGSPTAKATPAATAATAMPARTAVRVRRRAGAGPAPVSASAGAAGGAPAEAASAGGAASEAS
ncbi:hypothetical protein RKD47_002753 [Streptomyces albogriseolus]